MKNEKAKRRPVSDPYEVWKNHSGWTWKILKHYQSPDKEAANRFARVLAHVSSPFLPQGEVGDVYLGTIKTGFKVS